MKTTPRGFSSLIVLIVIAILVAGGAYYYFHSRSGVLSNTASSTSVVNADEATTTKPNSVNSQSTPSPKASFTESSYSVALNSEPTLTGTANVPYVRIAVAVENDVPGHPYNLNNPYWVLNDSGIVPVVNGKWSGTLKTVTDSNGQSDNNFETFGTTTVYVYAYSDSKGAKPLGRLGSTVVNVLPVSLNATASIDSSSLISTDEEPTLTGTTSGTNQINIFIAGFTQNPGTPDQKVHSQTDYQPFGYVIPVNGHWSSELPDSNIIWKPGTYPIQLRDANGKVLSSGTLKVL